MIPRLLPLGALLLFVGVGFGWRTWYQVRKHGSSGMMLFRGASRVQHVRDALVLLLVVVLTVEAVLAAVSPERLGGVRGPVVAVLRPAGAALVLLATALMVVAQLDLGASWRIGIEETARPGLVTDGFYRVCRNPIFLFMLTALVGFTLLLPTWTSLALLVGTYVGIQRQVRDEEAYLGRAYGDAYRAYARRVGRFVPGIGRLP